MRIFWEILGLFRNFGGGFAFLDVLFGFAISPSRSLGNLSCKVLWKDKDLVEVYTPQAHVSQQWKMSAQSLMK